MAMIGEMIFHIKSNLLLIFCFFMNYRSIVVPNSGEVQSLTIFRDFSVKSNYDNIIETNPCAIKNGGCEHICLYIEKQVKCECSSQYLNNDGKCERADDFLIFSQKNKISRYSYK